MHVKPTYILVGTREFNFVLTKLFFFHKGYLLKFVEIDKLKDFAHLYR